MQLLFLAGWFTDEMLRALCWTFIHSLWLGLLAAGLAGIIIVSTRKSTALLRYNLLAGVLLLFLISTAITFFLYNNNATVRGLGVPVVMSAEATVIIDNELSSSSVVSLPDKLAAWFNTNAGLFVLIWAIFFAVHCIKLVTGIAGVHRIRSYKTHEATVNWQAKLNYLSKILGINHPIRLLHSELVKIPVAVGFLKPVVLVPIGMLSNLPPEQAETIILHELAHIRRQDYLANLLQRFAEAVFFFNPALLWISSLIRQEREACCDDIVVANTSNKGSYLEALVSFQEKAMSDSGYVMAIGHKRNYLLNRVKRILTRENKKLNLMEKLLLVTGISVLMAFSFIPQNDYVVNKQAVSDLKKPVEQGSSVLSAGILSEPARTVIKKENKKSVVTYMATDTVPVPQKEKEKSQSDELRFSGISSSVNNDGNTKTETTTATDQNGKKYTITKLNNKITSLTIDGNKIPENEIDQYQQVLEKIDLMIQENKARREKEKEIRKMEMETRKDAMKKRTEDNKIKAKEAKLKNEEDKKQRELEKEERIKMKEKLAKEGRTKEKIKEEKEKYKVKDEKEDAGYKKRTEQKMKENAEKMEEQKKEYKERMEQQRKENAEKIEEQKKKYQERIEEQKKENAERMEEQKKKYQERLEEQKKQNEERVEELKKERKIQEQEKKGKKEPEKIKKVSINSTGKAVISQNRKNRVERSPEIVVNADRVNKLEIQKTNELAIQKQVETDIRKTSEVNNEIVNKIANNKETNINLRKQLDIRKERIKNEENKKEINNELINKIELELDEKEDPETIPVTKMRPGLRMKTPSVKPSSEPKQAKQSFNNPIKEKPVPRGKRVTT